MRIGSLPGTRFLEEGRGKQGAACGNLSGRIWSSLLKPPGDGFHKQRGYQVWHKPIGEGAEMVRAAYLAMDVTTWFVIVPLALVSLLSGVVSALGTTWGLFRYYWVLINS